MTHMRVLRRLLVAGGLALGLFAVPSATVLACSCAMPSAPAEVAETAELAFVGTVVDAGASAAGEFGPTIPYAFEVERASVEAPAVLVVSAGESDASCGMTFAIGERWFISAQTFDGTLSTGLCSGNVLAESMAEGELEAVMAALPVVPVTEPAEDPAPAASPPVEPAAEPTQDEAVTDWAPILAFIVAAVGVLGIAGVMFVAVRRPARS